MSYQGSPYSGPGDEYDFEDDGYDDLDEFREREDLLQLPLPAEDSDEGEFCLRSLSGLIGLFHASFGLGAAVTSCVCRFSTVLHVNSRSATSTRLPAGRCCPRHCSRVFAMYLLV